MARSTALASAKAGCDPAKLLCPAPNRRGH